MINFDIETACLILLDDSASYPIQLENDSGEQTGLHYQPLFLPAETENIALAFDGIQDFAGIFQININLPIDTNKTGLQDALNELDALFARGTDLIHGTTHAEIEKIYTVAGISNNPWYTVPVTIEYRAIL